MTDETLIADLLDAWHDAGDGSAAAELRRRLAASEADRRAYWRWMMVHRSLAGQACEQRSARSGRRAARRQRRSRWWVRAVPLAAAASLLGAVLAWWAWSTRMPIVGELTVDGSTRSLRRGDRVESSTAAVLRLPDARVDLDAGMRMRIPVDGRVLLALDGGRARFAVDGGHLRREFVIGLPRVLVRVTGTRFTLVADPAGDRVRVDQGEVRCDAGGLRGLPIVAGRQGVFAAGAPPRIADVDAGANTRPLPFADEAWRLLELRGTGSHRTPDHRATLDFVLDGAAEAEAWAALVAIPGTADWSSAAGVELTYRADPTPGVSYWFEATDRARRGEAAGRWQAQVINLPGTGAVETRRIPFAAFARRDPTPGGTGPRWDAIGRCGFGAVARTGARGRIVLHDLQLYGSR